MIRMLSLFAAGGLAVALSAPASAQSPQRRQCFSTSQIRSTLPVGDRQVNIELTDRSGVRIDLGSPCETLRRPSRVVELSPVANGVSVCTPGELRLTALADGSRQECFVDKITRLTPAEVAALPRKERP